MLKLKHSSAAVVAHIAHCITHGIDSLLRKPVNVKKVQITQLVTIIKVKFTQYLLMLPQETFHNHHDVLTMRSEPVLQHLHFHD
jgi:hypothetical protein